MFSVNCCDTHFGISKSLASMHGRKPEEVEELMMVVSEDQSIHFVESDKSIVDYWGWRCEEEERFIFIYPNRMLLEMCFVYGIENSERNKKGKVYRLEINKK